MFSSSVLGDSPTQTVSAPNPPCSTSFSVPAYLAWLHAPSTSSQNASQDMCELDLLGCYLWVTDLSPGISQQLVSSKCEGRTLTHCALWPHCQSCGHDSHLNLNVHTPIYRTLHRILVSATRCGRLSSPLITFSMQLPVCAFQLNLIFHSATR